jgi:Ricin-type beta-trefoil lectin domain
MAHLPIRFPMTAPLIAMGAMGVFGVMACSADAPSIGRASDAMSPPFVQGKSYLLQGRSRGLCLDSDLASAGRARAYRCESGWTSQEWNPTPIAGKPNVYLLRSAFTGKCMQIGTEPSIFSMSDCSPENTAAHWSVNTVDRVYVQITHVSSSLCLSSAASERDGALTAAACNSGYWSQHFQWLDAPAKNLNFSPYIDSDCYIFQDTQANGWYRLPAQLSPRCKALESNPSGGAKPRGWLISGYNEGIGATGYKPGPLIPPELTGDGKLWNFAFHPKADGTFQFGMAIDKFTFNTYRDQYTWAGFGDNFDQNAGFRRPLLSDDIVADLQIGLFGHNRGYDPTTAAEGFKSGMGKSRIMLGVLARWAGIDHFLEVVFWKDAEYDGCGATPQATWWSEPSSTPEPCDTTGLYDRRSRWAGGETLYYDAGQLQQILGYAIPTLGDGKGMVAYHLPITQLYKGYSWSGGPPGADASIAGIYIGLEVYGKASVWAELANYRLYGLGR